MIEVMESRGNLLWLRARGKLTRRDYQEVLIPRLEEAIREHGKARLLFHLDPDFQGWELGALWDDLKFDLKHRRDFEKLAVVGAPRWADAAVQLFSRFMAGEVKTMLPEQLAEAWEWIQDQPPLQTPPHRP
jgi:SpoIIAA-like